MENSKCCTKCGIDRPLSEFSNQKRLKDGKKTQCKECDRLYKQQYYARRRDHILEYQVEYSKDHPEVGRRANRKYHETHGEEIRRKARERDSANPEVKARSRSEAKLSNPVHILFMQTRSRAKKSGIPFSLEEDDLKVPEICPVLGISLRWSKGTRSPNTPSVDRIIPALGYIPENIAVISWRANRLKNDSTSAELYLIARWMDEQTQPA